MKALRLRLPASLDNLDLCDLPDPRPRFIISPVYDPVVTINNTAG